MRNSGHGALLRVDPPIGRVETVDTLPGDSRGLECFGGHAVIGLSQMRETAVFGGLPLQRDGRGLRCGLAIVNLATGEIEALFWIHSVVEDIVVRNQTISGVVFPGLLLALQAISGSRDLLTLRSVTSVPCATAGMVCLILKESRGMRRPRKALHTVWGLLFRACGIRS